LRPFIALVNGIRNAHPALQRNDTLRFHGVDNDALLCWSKTAGRDRVLVVVNLDPHAVQSGWTGLDLPALGIADGRPYAVHDLLTGVSYEWNGARNFVQLDPSAVPAHVFALDDGLGAGAPA
jgi:starch synthase (maltosyl-transferring)